jgi:hypothetical protein
MFAIMYKQFEGSKNVLISGCGGGYDIFCGLDLFFNLLEQGKHVILGSYTFTNDDLLAKVGVPITKYCYRIDNSLEFDEAEYMKDFVQAQLPPDDVLERMNYTKEEYMQLNSVNFNKPCYFPEYRLTKSLAGYNIKVPIYCFTGSGIKLLTEAYKEVVRMHDIDTIVLVDGGTDSLMTGVEINSDGDQALGTPFEDISSIIAVSNCNVPNRFLYTLGFNVDQFHGVTDENYLMNTAELIKQGYFIGAYMLSKHNESTKRYIDLFKQCNPENSIVNSHVISAIQGEYGNHCESWLKQRLGNSKQHIHPLMALYWVYHLDGIYKNLKYDVNKLKETIDETEISQLLKIR